MEAENMISNRLEPVACKMPQVLNVGSGLYAIRTADNPTIPPWDFEQINSEVPEF